MSNNKEVFVVFHNDYGLKKDDILGGFEKKERAWALCEANIFSLFKIKNYSIDEYEIMISQNLGSAIIKERTSIKVMHKIEYKKVIIY